MGNNISIGLEPKSLNELQQEQAFAELQNENELLLIKDIFSSPENISVKKTSDGNKDVFVFYKNNLPQYYISEENLVKYYELEAGQEREVAKESEIHEVMLKILLLNVYQVETTKLDNELKALQTNKQQEQKKRNNKHKRRGR